MATVLGKEAGTESVFAMAASASVDWGSGGEDSEAGLVESEYEWE